MRQIATSSHWVSQPNASIRSNRPSRFSNQPEIGNHRGPFTISGSQKSASTASSGCISATFFTLPSIKCFHPPKSGENEMTKREINSVVTLKCEDVCALKPFRKPQEFRNTQRQGKRKPCTTFGIRKPSPLTVYGGLKFGTSKTWGKA